MDKTINSYINQLHLDPKKEKAVRKIVELAGGSASSDNNNNNNIGQSSDVIELTLEKLYPDDDNDRTYKIEDFFK